MARRVILRVCLFVFSLGFVAATSLLGLSLDECVRKSAEAQTAKAALEQQSIPAAVVPTQSPSVTQHTCCCASKKTGESNDRGSSTPIDLSSRRETCDAGNSQPVVSSSTSGPPWKDEFSRRDRQSVNGVYVV